MNIKASLAMLIIFFCNGAVAQPKAYSFSEIQSRNNKQQWQEFLKADEDCVAYFSDDGIALNIDRLYHLKIKSMTHLPNKGVIYLCQDENLEDVTITLIGNERMFVYNDQVRLQINFVRTEIAGACRLPGVNSKVTPTVATTQE